MIVSESMQALHAGGSAIRRMFETGLRLKQLHGADRVADLSIGNPMFAPPAAFTSALRRLTAQAGRHAYMPNAGYPEVRSRVAESLDARGLVPGATRDDIVMTSGAAGAINVVLRTILSPGDEVIVIRPYFLEYGLYIGAQGGRMVLVDSGPSCDLDPAAIAAAIGPSTRAVLLNTPNNPSGRVYSAQRLKELATVLAEGSRAQGRPILLISDEPYREIVFDAPFASPAAFYPDTFVCYSWSKAFSIPGERIGYIATTPSLRAREPVLIPASLGMANRFLGFVNAPALMQQAIGETVDVLPDIDHYRVKRDRLQSALLDAGFESLAGEGSFYLLPRVPDGEDDVAFCDRAAERLLLAVPGSAFGRPGFFRLCFAASDQTVDLACRLISELKA